jgi:hypothetical protein
MWIYRQSTGELFCRMKNETASLEADHLVGRGYSGSGKGKNNPDMQSVKNVGPVPRGLWRMQLITDANGKAIDYESKRAPVIRLIPDTSTNLYGRSGLLIHGDAIAAPGTASHGCIIEDYDIRLMLADAVYNGDDKLQVTF